MNKDKKNNDNKKINKSTCSGNIVDFEVLQSDWLRAIWPISQEQDFFLIYGICAGTHQISVFIIEQF